MRHLIFISLCSLLWTACGNTDNDFDASGTFEATEILVSSEANGKIMELNIEEGDRLDAGAIVGYVDSTQLFLRKMQLSASLRSVDIRKPDIRKQIAVLEQQIATAKTEQQRQENLVRAKAGNQKQLDDIVNNIKYLQKQLDAQYSSLSKTTGVDPVSRSEFWDMLDRLKRQGITILVSTPYMDEASRCDRIALVRSGECLSIDTPVGIRTSFDRRLYAVRCASMYKLLGDLREFPDTNSCFAFGDAHHLTLRRDGEDVMRRLQEYLKGKGYADVSIERLESSVEDCFMAL